MDYTYTCNILGLPCTETDHSTKLEIVWVKKFNELYCDHAYIQLEYIADSLFGEETSKVSIEVLNKAIDKKQRDFNITVTRYLPFRTKGSIAKIPLNDPDLLKALTTNIWTQSPKDGTDLQLKVTPTNIEVKIDQRTVSFDFDYKKFRTPFLMIRTQLLSLEEGDKFIQKIILY